MCGGVRRALGVARLTLTMELNVKLGWKRDADCEDGGGKEEAGRGKLVWEAGRRQK